MGLGLGSIDHPSSLPGHLVGHVFGLSHLGGVEHQVDVVVLS
jgi:hypothetical protein